MDKSQVINSLAKELKGRDTALYCFQPPSNKENFIAEGVLVGGAVVLITAFLNGLESTLKPGVQKWGAAIGTWISQRLGSLFESKQADKAELDSAADRASSLMAAASPQRREQVATEVEKALGDALVKNGVLSTDAKAIAASTRQSAMAIAT